MKLSTSEQIQEFKQTSYWEMFIKKLENDFVDLSRDLRNCPIQDVDFCRGKLAYLEGLFNWFEEKAVEDQLKKEAEIIFHKDYNDF